MSRFTLICSLVFGLSAASFVGSADAQFAKAPPTTVAMAGAAAHADAPQPASYPRMPRRWLDRDTVRAALVKARAANLAAFRTYQTKGIFPSNTYKPGKLNVWLDENGNLCAAATIIKMSGKADLVSKVAEQNNFIRLADVKQGPLMDWILASGFTQAEIAMIQEPFMPVVREPALAPSKPILADSKLRKAEDARLRATYKKVEAQLVKASKKSLDKATDLLMKHPDVAFQLIDVQSAS
jgi:hypothetical protein